MNNSNQVYECYKDSEIELRQDYIKDFYEILQTQSDINQKDDSYTILIRLAWTGRLDLVKLAVDAGADVNIITEDNSFALYEAARQGWQEVYDYLTPLTSPELVEIAAKAFPKGLIYRQRKNNYAVEVFVNAAFYGNIDAVCAAISQGIDVNAISSNGEAALHKAIRNNQLSTVHILLEVGANPHLQQESVQGYPPLMIALNSAKISNDIFQALLEAGADINSSSSQGQTVLMLAVFKLNTKAVQQLLELGTDFNAKDENGYTALAIAKELSKQGFWNDTKLSEIIQLLESYGASEN
ncbi:ankyrin repeat domain-containing protein [Nostoc sp. 'Peltigera membranacea cyanobiont' N6]|uniref:ankyrin repeat domain-containing protein n=1 Tax=Nostoc sp. 'Peltigera membranacea cyanobiont' N6 TaxID=1261031 RepID=UPI000CF304F0|nr:ankyrin repeat domain-containing protein [Nostoc sp. 'Peltigera membranacea cyanobiont' N6]AVH64094.1 ankyrin repeat-containing protein [Nostoc sp. 'Peltigera membranacea cyanobiont' N6]